ncbi:hypothetical protein [Ferruginibacter sp.]
MSILSELRRRNNLLYWCGIFNIAVGVICFALQFTDDVKILGVSRWLKPMKFYLSVGLLAFTLNWLMYYLSNSKLVKIYSWIIAITMLIENGVILMQAVRGTTSHFNISSPFNGIAFGVMGIIILIFTITAVFITINFFVQKKFSISPAYVWGIRLGLGFFILASVEGGLMIGLFTHTAGAKDGSEGLPLLNWSKQYGDLRIAHFFGLHALQILPLLGYYIAKNKNQLFVFAGLYLIFITALFIQAVKGIPLFF